MTFNKLILASSLSAVMLSSGFSAGVSAAGNTAMQQGGMDHSAMQHGDMNQNGMSQEAMSPKMSQEMSGEMNHDSMSQGMSDNKMFLEQKDIDGYTVSFHVMAAEEGMSHGGTHNLMIKVEQQGAVVSGAQMNSKVIYPDGTEESKPLMAMGEWQMAGYDLKESGKHQLMVLFKTPDGKKHFGGLYYSK